MSDYKLISRNYEESIKERTSFRRYLFAFGILGLVIVIFAIWAYFLDKQTPVPVLISWITAGALIEIITGIYFYAVWRNSSAQSDSLRKLLALVNLLGNNQGKIVFQPLSVPDDPPTFSLPNISSNKSGSVTDNVIAWSWNGIQNDEQFEKLFVINTSSKDTEVFVRVQKVFSTGIKFKCVFSYDIHEIEKKVPLLGKATESGYVELKIPSDTLVIYENRG